MKIDIPHSLSPEEALARIRNMLSKLKEEQGERISNVREEWSGHTGKFNFTMQGFELSGTIQVMPANVEIDADLPFALSFFKGKISEVVLAHAKKVLAN